jgi:hypothetical protein
MLICIDKQQNLNINENFICSLSQNWGERNSQSVSVTIYRKDGTQTRKYAYVDLARPQQIGAER